MTLSVNVACRTRLGRLEHELPLGHPDTVTSPPLSACHPGLVTEHANWRKKEGW